MKLESEKRKLLLFLIFILLSSWIVLEAVSFVATQRKFLEVSYLDVGQGDATLISYLGKYQVLIDGGPSGDKLLTELEKRMPIMDKQIEVVILTHPDLDHLAGLIDVVKYYKVGIFLDNGQKADTQIFGELQEVLGERDIKREALTADSKIKIGKHLALEVFNPMLVAAEQQDRNENSLVLRLDFGINSFLFMGDASSEVEEQLIEQGKNLDVDWLKVAHHGSKHSTSQDFIQKTSPQLAIISVGAKNRYQHPHTEVIKKITDQKIELLRTDRDGTVLVSCASINEACLTVFK